MSDFNATKYKNDFNKEAYDRVSINFPKGSKDIIKAHWKSRGYSSLNAYVNDLINRDMAAHGDNINVNVQNNSGIVVNKGTVNISHDN